MNKLQAEIIVKILDFLDTGDMDIRVEIAFMLQKQAKKFHISIRRSKAPKDLKKSLRKYILNNEGYLETIPDIFNALNNL